MFRLQGKENTKNVFQTCNFLKGVIIDPNQLERAIKDTKKVLLLYVVYYYNIIPKIANLGNIFFVSSTPCLLKAKHFQTYVIYKLIVIILL